MPTQMSVGDWEPPSTVSLSGQETLPIRAVWAMAERIANPLFEMCWATQVRRVGERNGTEKPIWPELQVRARSKSALGIALGIVAIEGVNIWRYLGEFGCKCS
jgi:hypothetical protein